MSLFDLTALRCPVCETVTDFQAVGSVNADRRPDLREAILEESFQVVTCPSCAEVMRLEPMMNYLDVELGLWLASYPARRIGDHAALRGEVQALFDQSYGVQASDAAQGVGAGLQPRLVFGWPATREKLLLRQQGLDDGTLEMLKLDLLRRLPEAPLYPGVEMRVVQVHADSLAVVWIDAASEEVLDRFSASRALVEEIEGNAEGWAEMRGRLTDNPFVDMQKLYLEQSA